MLYLHALLTDSCKPSIEDLLRELAALGVNIEILQEAGLSEEELRDFADAVKALMKKRKPRHNTSVC